MNTLGIGPTAVFANLVAPFSPVGKQAVGLENAEAKEEALAPVEESAKTASALNRDDEQEQSVQLLGEQGQQSEIVDEQGANEQRAEQQRADNDLEKRQQQEQLRVERQLIAELSARDREVRAHEQAHAAVGGKYAGAPSFSFERGPDGVNYAVSGEVPISLPRIGDDPQAALRAAEQVRQAALAPAEPSAQDQRVAAQAAQIAVEARAELVALENEQRQQEAAEQQAQRVEQEQEKEQQLEKEREKQEQERQQQLIADSRRRVQDLGDQLVTVERIDSEQAVGAFLDQRV